MRTTSRVLHVVENLGNGAVETWLLRMLRHARAQGLALDWSFYCALGEEGVNNSEGRMLATEVLRSPTSIGNKFAFVANLRRELRRGKFQILHCHHDLVSGVYLLASAGLPIRRRIVHVHNADEQVLTANPAKRFIYRHLLRRVCLKLADRIVAISKHTLDTFIRGRERQPGRDSVLLYGVDPEPFREPRFSRAGFRESLELPNDSRILLFAGRLVPEKNPLFALNVLEELQQFDRRVVGIFAGAGSLEQALSARARELGLGGSVRLLGWRHDLPDVMCCSDWFILPHPEEPMEGFGLAVVEAQLAGLHLLLSRGVPDDPLLPSASFSRLSLSMEPPVWAKAAMELLQRGAPSRATALAELAESPMDMDRALEGLLRLHTL